MNDEIYYTKNTYILVRFMLFGDKYAGYFWPASLGTETRLFIVAFRNGEGLVPTLFSVNELLERFAETNGVPCRLVDSRGMQKYGGLPQDGDRMELLSPEGKSIRRWAIGVKRAALPARLHLDRTRATVNVPGILTLDLS